MSNIWSRIEEKRKRNVDRKTCSERRKISLLKDLKIRKRLEEKVIKLVDVGVQNMWGHVKNGVLKTYDEGEKQRRYIVVK